MPVKYGGIPFKEAIAFLRDKVDIPTESWDDLQGIPHAKAFTIAGATKMSLIADFHTSLDNIILRGGTINDFRKDFDHIVKKHGWTYNGKRGWRTRIIYNTNMRAAHMAGKWEYFQHTKKNRPYLQYLTVNDARVRDQHRQWHNKILKIDDPFWDTHYPPNGWGCRCTVRTLSDRQLKKKGLQLSNSPTVNKNPDGKLEGIDTGFDYNVGKAWLAPDTIFGENIMNSPKDIRTKALNRAAQKFTKPLDPAFRHFVRTQIKQLEQEGQKYRSKNYIKTAGFLSGDIVNALNKYVKPLSAVIMIKDQQVVHMLRDSKKIRNAALTNKQALNISKTIRQPDAVLYDKKDPAILYTQKIDETYYLKLVIRTNYLNKSMHNEKRYKLKGNFITTAGIVKKEDLKIKRYVLLKGSM